MVENYRSVMKHQTSKESRVVGDIKEKEQSYGLTMNIQTSSIRSSVGVVSCNIL